MEKVKVSAPYFHFVMKWFACSFFAIGMAVWITLVEVQNKYFLAGILFGVGLVLLLVGFYKYNFVEMDKEGFKVKSLFFTTDVVKWKDVTFIQTVNESLSNKYGTIDTAYPYIEIQTVCGGKTSNDFISQENGKAFLIKATDKNLTLIMPFLDTFTTCPRKGFKKKR